MEVVLGIVGDVGDAVDGVGTVVVVAPSVVGTDAATGDWGDWGDWVAVARLVRRPEADWLNPATNASTITNAALVADKPHRWRDAPVRSLDA